MIDTDRHGVHSKFLFPSINKMRNFALKDHERRLKIFLSYRYQESLQKSLPATISTTSTLDHLIGGGISPAEKDELRKLRPQTRLGQILQTLKKIGMPSKVNAIRAADSQ